MTLSILTQEFVKEIFHYDPETGEIKYRARSLSLFDGNERIRNAWNSRCSGKIAGNICTKGYRFVHIFRERHKAHRIAWLYVHGKYPEHQIDHINGIRSDNRIVNLRAVTNADNAKNMSRNKRNKSGVTGVFWSSPRGRWMASICYNYKDEFLGSYKDFFEAVCARKSAANKYGFHENHGKLNKRGI